MDLFKNGVGRPSNETLRKRNIIRIIIVVSIIAIISIIMIFFKNKTTMSVNFKPKYIKDNVNSELKNVYAFTYYSYGSTLKGQTNEIIALTKDNKLIKLASIQQNNAINSMAYYDGKLYFNTDGEYEHYIANIDLTKGNGNYEIEEAELDFDIDENEDGHEIVPINFDIVDGIMYFTSAWDSYLRSYNLKTKKVEIIDGSNEPYDVDIHYNFIDKTNKKIYYQRRDSKELYSYDITNKEKKKLSNEWMYIDSYFNGTASYVSSDRSKTIIYDTQTDEKKVLNNSSECINDGIKYICNDGYRIYTIDGKNENTILKANKNELFADIVGLLENNKMVITIGYDGNRIVDLSKKKIVDNNPKISNFIYYLY